MSHYVVGLVFGALAAVALMWGLGLLRRGGEDDGARITPAEVAYDLLREVRGGSGQPRYLVQVIDQAGVREDPQMRWQWRVWDAEEGLRLAAYPGDGQDPEGDTGMGATPYMLGNTSTEVLATISAVRWCREHGRTFFVAAAPQVGGA